MRLPATFIAAGLLSACSSNGTSVPDMIKDHNPKACSADDVKMSVLTLANNQYPKFLSEGLEPLVVDTISVTNINETIDEISCSANVPGRTYGTLTINTIKIDYKLRPMLDNDEDYVVEMESMGDLQKAIGAHHYWFKFYRDNAALENTKAVIEAGTQATDSAASEVTSSEEASPHHHDGDSCKSKVIHQVAAEEDPTSTLEPGESWDDVTQFWRNKATGDTRYCQHGGYCYPSHVVKNGKKVEAIKLLNCSVKGAGEDDGEDVLYYVG